MKRWMPTVLVWSLLGCQAAPPEPPPVPDHLLEDVAQLGADLRACREAERARLEKEKSELDVEIAETKKRIATYRLLVGESEYRRIVGDGGSSR